MGSDDIRSFFSKNSINNTSPRKEHSKHKLDELDDTTLSPTKKRATESTMEVEESPIQTMDDPTGDRDALSLLKLIPGLSHAHLDEYDSAKKMVENGIGALPDCSNDYLAGIRFVFIGKLTSMIKEEIIGYIKGHGGKILTTLSKSTSLVVLGVDADKKKIEKIKSMEVKIIDEMGLLKWFELIAASNNSENELATPKTSKSTNSKTRSLEKKEKSHLPLKQSTPNDGMYTDTAQIDEQKVSASDILLTIPNAELPAVDTNAESLSYFQLKARQAEAPAPMGQVSIPNAKENCLAGIRFVFTGVLPNLSREESKALAERYGGKVASSISKSTTCVVLGSEAGPKKISQIKAWNIKCIDEAGFLELLARMPADGGSGTEAKKAMDKRRAEEQKAINEALKMEQTSVPAAQSTKGKTRVKDNDNGKLSTASEILWTDKYAPTNLSQICGNKGQVEKLNKWLANWQSNLDKDFKGVGADGSGVFRAALIHGPPGIGKTTTAHLLARLNGYDIVEMNASDTRSKSLLSQSVGTVLDSRSIGETKNSLSKKLLIMDEVDGMSGGDRGGVGEMAAFCKKTKIPIILICNEKTIKMRPFDRVTFDLPFRKPDATQVRSRIMTIAVREGLKLSAPVIDQLVTSAQSDIRQVINLLSTYSRTNKEMDFDQSREAGKQWQKAASSLKPWDIISKLFSAQSSHLSLNDKIELYFMDHDMTPLMVQENYLQTAPRGSGDHLADVVSASESISDGDMVDALIHGSQQQWSLMPLHGVLSTVRPCSYIAGQMMGRINFTSYLGNLSKGNKYWRLLQELSSHMRLSMTGTKSDVRYSYVPSLAKRLLEPLTKHGSDGIEEVITLMDAYYLTREDWDTVMELIIDNSADPKTVPTSVKTAFTRAYNTQSHPVPFMKMNASMDFKVKKEAPDLEDVFEDEEVLEDDDEQEKDDSAEDLSKDKYISSTKRRKTATAKGTTKAKSKTKSKVVG